MSEPTTTLQALRRAIAQELRMDFFRRFAAGYVAEDAGGTTSIPKAHELSQEDDYWIGAWMYHVEGQESSLITDSDQSDTNVTLEVAYASISNGDKLEIYNIWNALDIHNAINKAIEAVNRIFMDTVDDETLVLCEDTLKYTISGLTKTPWVVARVAIENVTTVKRGTIVSAASTSFTVESSSILSGVNSNWKVSIYAGTGAGQLRAITSVAGATGNVAAWATVPDTTSKYAIWNPTQQVYDWQPTSEWYLDAKEYPDSLYFKRLYMSNYGLRMRISYISPPSSLSAETDSTIIPKQYIIFKACSILHGQACNNTKVDHDLHLSEFERYNVLAEDYLNKNMPHKPDILMKSPSTPPSYMEDDPLGWVADGPGNLR